MSMIGPNDPLPIPDNRPAIEPDAPQEDPAEEPAEDPEGYPSELPRLDDPFLAAS